MKKSQNKNKMPIRRAVVAVAAAAGAMGLAACTTEAAPTKVTVTETVTASPSPESQAEQEAHEAVKRLQENGKTTALNIIDQASALGDKFVYVPSVNTGYYTKQETYPKTPGPRMSVNYIAETQDLFLTIEGKTPPSEGKYRETGVGFKLSGASAEMFDKSYQTGVAVSLEQMRSVVAGDEAVLDYVHIMDDTTYDAATTFDIKGGDIYERYSSTPLEPYVMQHTATDAIAAMAQAQQ